MYITGYIYIYIFGDFACVSEKFYYKRVIIRMIG